MIHIYNFINYYHHWLAVTAVCESSSGGRVTSDPLRGESFLFLAGQQTQASLLLN